MSRDPDQLAQWQKWKNASSVLTLALWLGLLFLIISQWMDQKEAGLLEPGSLHIEFWLKYMGLLPVLGFAPIKNEMFQKGTVIVNSVLAVVLVTLIFTMGVL